MASEKGNLKCVYKQKFITTLLTVGVLTPCEQLIAYTYSIKHTHFIFYSTIKNWNLHNVTIGHIMTISLK